MKIKHQLPPEDDFDYWKGIENQWRKTLIRMNEKELYDIFLAGSPKIISDKIHELQTEYDLLESAIIDLIHFIQKESKDETEKKVLQGILEQIHIRDLLLVERELKRFYMYRHFKDGKTDTIIDIQKAKQFPIERLVEQSVNLKRSGQNFLGLCPLHKEKSPSFYLYTNTNSFYCFGCSSGGDVIHLAQLLNKFTFPEAVQYLITNL